MKILLYPFFIMGILFGSFFARNNDAFTGNLKGFVKNIKGDALSGANIVIMETQAGCSSDLYGFFEFNNISPGEYTLRISYVSYETQYKKIKVSEQKSTELVITLIQSLFQIGGIEVIGSTELLPKDAFSKTLITSGEIEHYQASSVKDVLTLVPGVQRTANPGLSQYGQAAIRGDIMDKVSTFGTLILLDGVPVTNNSDMQFEKPNGPFISSPKLMSGIDLRTIPADNIESIEVLTGLPSAAYGDFTEGIVNIKTKTGLQPNRFKIKDNPDTREANFGGSRQLGENVLSYNINLARSERDIRIEGDEYSRLTAQTGYSTQFFNNLLKLNHKINAQFLFDEEQPKGDLHKIINYNRGYTLGYSNSGSYSFHENQSNLNFNLFATMQREKSMRSKLVESDLRVLPNGDTVASYLGKVETRGVEWTLGGKLAYNKIYFTGEFIHKITLGTDVQYNANTGEGVMFDTVYNYYGPDAGKKPYSFSSIPGNTLLSFFAEDQIMSHFIFDFRFTLGARYEMYQPFRFNPKGLRGEGDLISSHNGSYFNPRINLIIYITDHNQIRINAGRTSKSPAMGLLYPPEEVFKWRNPETYRIAYFRYNCSTPDLKGIQEDQAEISYDHKFFDDIGTTITFFYKERKNETRDSQFPVFSISAVNKGLYYIGSYYKQANSGWNTSRGMEFLFKTNRIRPLNMNFQVSGSYSYADGTKGGTIINMQPDLSKGQYPNYKFMDTLIGFAYPNYGSLDEKFQINYYLKYTLPVLGLWVSLRAEQMLIERKQSYNLQPENYDMLTDAGKQKYLLLREVKSKGPKWLLDFNVSISLYRDAELSFYVNNFLDDPAIRRYEMIPNQIVEESRNPVLSYGIEFSTMLDEILK